jgi:hypothetical protein
MGVPTGPGSYDAHFTLETACASFAMLGVVEVESYEDPGDSVDGPWSSDGFCRCTDPTDSTCVRSEARRFARVRLRASDGAGASLEGTADAPHCHDLHIDCI